MKKLLLSSSLLILGACSGNNGSSTAVPGSSDLPTEIAGAISGTAAVGAPLVKSKVVILGQGCQKSSSTNSSGVYSVNMGDCQGPYLIRVEGSLSTVYSIATNEDVGKIVNASPLTSLVSSLVLGKPDLTGENGASVASVTVTQISNKKNIVKVILAPILEEFGAENVDFVSGAFAANGNAMDRVLDSVSITPKDGNNISLGLKDGTTLDINKDADETAAATAASTVSTKVADIKLTMGDLDTIAQAANSYFIAAASGGNLADFCHPEFLHEGYAGVQGCQDYYELEAGSYKVTRPVILEKSSESMWVAFDVMELVGSDYVLDLAGVITQFKKHNGEWRLFGNQVDYESNFLPAKMQIDGTSIHGYYFQIYSDLNLSGKNVQFKFLGSSQSDNLDYTIDATLDSFGQLATVESAGQLCSVLSNTNYSWLCLKGYKVDQSKFKSNLAKVTLTYPDPSDLNNSKSATFYVRTPKGMNETVPVPTFQGENGTTTTNCKATISGVSWDFSSGLDLDEVNPVWHQSNAFHSLVEGEYNYSGDDGSVTVAPVYQARTPFDATQAFTMGYSAFFLDSLQRIYVYMNYCE